jgi:uncharacterized protein
MRLSLDSDPRINLVRRYDAGVIVIGEQRITRPCIVTPQQLLLDWTASSIDELSKRTLRRCWRGAPISCCWAREKPSSCPAAPCARCFALRELPLNA